MVIIRSMNTRLAAPKVGNLEDAHPKLNNTCFLNLLSSFFLKTSRKLKQMKKNHAARNTSGAISVFHA